MRPKYDPGGATPVGVPVMILWCDGDHDAVENMRRDRALLERTERLALGPQSAADPVVLRVFSFSPPGITIGRSQDPAIELDLERCSADGVSWAVRPTGGRAIFHGEEWTYSLVAPLNDPEWGGSLAQAYERLSRVLLASLRRLGVVVEFARSSPAWAGPRVVAKGAVAPPCFASSGSHEIVRGGRKLVGSAQRRTAVALLQQGSVLLGDGHLRLIDYLRAPDSSRSEIREQLRAHSTHAGDVLGAAESLESWASALAPDLSGPLLRLAGEEGEFLLTPVSPGSYTESSV